MQFRKLSLALLVLMLAVVAPWVGAQDSTNPLIGTQWILVAIDGSEALPDADVTIAFGDDGTMFGSGGCNSYSGAFTINGDAIQFEAPISTMMACSDAITNQEINFLNTLQMANSFAVNGDTLTLNYGDNQQMIFARMMGLEGSAWELVSIADAAVIAGSALDITFGEDGRVGGNTGCNTFGGSYTATPGNLSLSELFSTERACVDNNLNQQERAYLDALASASAYTIDGDTLTLTYAEGTLVFTRVQSLANSSWNLVSIDGTPALENIAATLVFDTEGNVGGRGSCNGFGGTYTLDGETLSISALFSTMMACAEDIMAQESAYLGALQSATAYAIDGDTLTITYGEGQQLVLARAESLVGSSWQLVTIDGSAALENAPVTLTFGEDGNAGGAGSCNTYGATYVIDGNSLAFGPAFSTKMACAEDIMAQEMAYFGALETVTGYELNGDTLTLIYGEGQQLVFSRTTGE